METAELTELTEFAHELADAADAITRQHFRTPLEIEGKADSHFDPVTKADRETEVALRDMIVGRYPEHGIIGEEFGSSNINADLVWVLDPIDGTRNYMTGFAEWGTLIGLQSKGAPVIGVMSQGHAQERYWSDGISTFYRDRYNQHQLYTRSCASLANATIASSPAFLSSEEAPRFERLAEACQLMRCDKDCHQYARLAAGQLDIVAEADLKIYDIAALIPIVEAAGGRVTNWKGDPPDDDGQILAVGDPSILDQAISALN